MALEDFNFDYHKTSVQYPESGTRLKMGNSYTATTEPVAPDQRIITVEFQAMRYQCDSVGLPDLTWNPPLNLHLLEAFYKRHRMWKMFSYTHPIYGPLAVRFNKPLQIPKPANGGWVSGLTVEFEEQPL